MAAAQSNVTETEHMTLESAGAFLPSHETTVMTDFRKQLIAQGLSEKEWLAKAAEFFGSQHFQHIPTVRLGSFIWATVAYRAARGQKKLPSAGFFNDVDFISAFLPYCDAIFVDKECHGILDDKHMQGVISEYGTKIFSLRNKEDFLAYLDGIEHGASADHQRLLNEVYGESYLRPYTELFSGSKE